jgi:hypothetical protein
VADKLTSATVVSQGGLNSTENHLILDAAFPGGATQLLNYEVGLYGGYRRINGYDYFDSSYKTVDDTNAEGPILGLIIYSTISNTQKIFAARKQKASNTYKLYLYDSGTGWTAVVTGLTLSSVGVTKLRTHQTTIQGTAYLIIVDGTNTPVLYDGTTWSQPTGDQSLTTAKYVTSFYNHIFFSGDPTFPEIVYHSAPNDPTDYSAAGGAGQLIAGYTVQQIRAFRESLYVWGKERIKNITVDNTDFVINDVATDIGTIASDSVIEMNGDILFLAQDGVRTIGGTNKIGDINLASISRQIQLYINNIQSTFNLDLLNSAVIKKKSQFRYFVSGGTLADTGYGLIGGLRDQGTDQGQGAVWEFGQLIGIRTTCVENGYIDDVETTLHGDYDGSVYIQETGNSFGGSSITSVYSTPYLTFGDILTRKVGRKIHTFVRAEGTVTLTVKPTLDWGGPERSQSAGKGINTTVSGSVYGSSTTIYGTAVYGVDADYPILTTTLEGSFNSLKLTYTSSGVYAPHSIQGFVVEFTPEGTRTLT